ncbi:hypothetical protein [Rhizobium sp. 42MFCr.1]|uniref:hypothetical protein n=1 Tax=Rhizobium sp. 42MFCr.1 TaxID=1048680 RepID=UPI000371D44D|nr:hypothetical protein [Rhizobium sp. 42MFCr.1]
MTQASERALAVAAIGEIVTGLAAGDTRGDRRHAHQGLPKQKFTDERGNGDQPAPASLATILEHPIEVHQRPNGGYTRFAETV